MISKCILKCITNNCKPPKNLDSSETQLSFSFRFVWFENFPFLCYCLWEDKAYCLPSALFGHIFGHKIIRNSTLQNLYKKPYGTWPAGVKTFKKHQNAPTRTHKKSQIILCRFVDEYT